MSEQSGKPEKETCLYLRVREHAIRVQFTQQEDKKIAVLIKKALINAYTNKQLD